MKLIRGLMLKDWALMARQSKFMLAYIVVFVGIFSFTMSDSSFIASFLSVILFMLALNCFAYDEQVHFEKLLAAAPVPPLYAVAARYFAALCVGVCGSAVIVLVQSVTAKLRRMPELSLNKIYLSILAGLGVSLFILSVLFPLVYKFGVNKSRIMIFVLAGIPALFFVLLSNMLPQDVVRFVTIPTWLLDSLPYATPFALIAALALSMTISVHIIRNKEY